MNVGINVINEHYWKQNYCCTFGSKNCSLGQRGKASSSLKTNEQGGYYRWFVETEYFRILLRMRFQRGLGLKIVLSKKIPKVTN